MRLDHDSNPSPWKRWAVSLLTAAAISTPALATVDFPLTPLQIGSTVSPNILFILDDSGSMQFEIMPESDIVSGVYDRRRYYAYYLFPPPGSNPSTRVYLSTYYTGPSGRPVTLDFDSGYHFNVVLRSSQRNQIFYNPQITYEPWRNADGSRMANSPATAAPWNPTHAGAGTLNLTAQQSTRADWFTECSTVSNCDIASGGTRSYYPITFYVYKGSGSDTDRANYIRYQYRGGRLYRWDLATSNATETAVTGTLPWGRTVADEIQNFANWFTYYRSRVLAARAGASQAFADLGSGYRVGFITINAASGTGSVTGVDPSSNTAGTSYLPIPTTGGFEGSNKSDFYTRLLNTRIPAQGTPLRIALDWAGRYFQRTDAQGPWGPGANANTQVSCRRNYTILTTDGYWNDDANTLGHIGNSDNSNGPVHVSALSNRSDTGYVRQRPYRDDHSTTLADVAMHYWKNDLRPDMPNNVPGSDTDAFWQHMVTFGLSIGVQGTLNPATDLPALTSGARAWPNPTSSDEAKIDDLWHASVNGRGTFTAARNPEQFRLGLVQALRNIQNRSSSASNVAANSTQLVDGARVFQASFEVLNNEWIGDLKAYPISASGLSSTPSWSAQELLRTRSASSRRIFSHNGTSGVEFVWSQLSASQQASLGAASVVDYLRGDRSREYDGADAVARPYRPRTQLLGDIVHSSPAFNSDSRTVFVGANDGMLHAFNADNGQEVFAYVPGMIVPRLRALSGRDYTHQYFVDGEIAVSQRSQTGGRNYLIASLGRGGKGLFGLDVTDPSTFGASQVLWELSGNQDDDLGNVLGKPVIVRLNTGEWAALVGNGYNSTNGRAVLLVVRLSDGQVLARFNTGVGSSAASNGLATPAAFDADGNGTVDFAYAGDLLGNLWKFDLQAASSGGWSIANGGLPLFTAVGPDLQPQPITAAPAVVTNTRNGSTTYGSRYVLFGTGRYLTSSDPNVTNVQTIYGLIDNGTTILGRTQLRQRTITGSGMVAGRSVRTFSAAAANDMSGQRGWFMDLLTPPSNTAQGERVVSAATVVNLAYPTLLVASIIPEVTQCSSSGRGYLNALDPFSGGALPGTIFDVNNDNAFNNADTLDGGIVGSVDLGVGMGTEAIVVGNRAVQGGSNVIGGPKDIHLNMGGARVGRISWREIVR
ncbi:MAG: type IV pilus biogenesis factor PilY1 [Caldimonas sp.]|nr:MAG: type IV pilus biogenesis factor PilY1 [Caldimonas sp.]